MAICIRCHVTFLVYPRRRRPPCHTHFVKSATIQLRKSLHLEFWHNECKATSILHFVMYGTDALYPKHSTQTHSAQQIDYTHSNLLSVAEQMALYPTSAALLKICAHHDEANNNRFALCCYCGSNDNRFSHENEFQCENWIRSQLMSPLILGILCNLNAYVRCLVAIYHRDP